jgi:hypothetical protein
MAAHFSSSLRALFDGGLTFPISPRSSVVEMGEPLRALEGVSPAKARSMTTAKAASEGVKVAKEQASEQSLNELVQRASSQTASLVRKEIRLAQVELQEGKRAGIGAGMFGGSGVVALYGVGTLTAAAILALATA